MRRLVALSLMLAGLAPSAAPAQIDDPMNPWLRRALDSEVPAEERGGFRLDYAHWFLDELPVPPLVTTGPLGSQAVVGEPGTEILRGGSLTSRHVRYTGVRLVGDWWLRRGSPLGVHWSATLLERNSSNITFRPNTITPLARPYRDENGAWQSFIIAGDSPPFGPLSGSINVYSRMEIFQEDVNLKLRLNRSASSSLDLLAGGRFIQLRERLDLTSASRVLPAETTLIGTADHIQTFDKFYGGQLGLLGEWRRGRWAVTGKGTIAVGATQQEIRTKGDRVLHTPQARTTEDYGLFVLPSNTGAFDRTVADLVTEWDVSLRWAMTSRFRWRAGYTLLTWNNPVRPGDQIEPLNLSQVTPGGLVGPLTPTVPFREDFFWAQGFHLGFEARW